ncbi:hypothetical protein Scep_024957 [Stephania cephalantha]|uniref:Protein FAR1-RELATED SEQUENCE n=1 Tax=Stephania cephalantha TaxID=152367 RepID=A0AAP0F0D8_9MAGN
MSARLAKVVQNQNPILRRVEDPSRIIFIPANRGNYRGINHPNPNRRGGGGAPQPNHQGIVAPQDVVQTRTDGQQTVQGGRVENDKDVNQIQNNIAALNDGESSRGRDVENEEDGDVVPRKGMTFNSKEDVHNFYNRYAQHVGFGTKIRGTWKNDRGEVTRHILACVREGKCDTNKERKSPKRITSRCNCKASITARVMEDGVWYLTSVNLEHNHVVSPSMIKFFRSNRKGSGRGKRKLEESDPVELPIPKSFLTFARSMGGIETLSSKKRDKKYNIESSKRLSLGEGDIAALCLYFMYAQKQNSNFFHLEDIDDEGYLTNVFWADARSRALYRYFSDVVSLETTYLTNKYAMPLVMFVGVNHHGQSVLLGCGLLSSETIDNYEWLFTTWLTCMSGRVPGAIIIDECPYIQVAVSKVFPTSSYRVCLCDVMKKVPEKLGAYKDYEQIVWTLKNVVYDSLRVDEFDQLWCEMIEKFGLQENEWLRSLFEIRSKWVPAYVKNFFWAGVSSLQRDENSTAFFDGYVNAKTALKQFISQYEVAMSKKYEKEAFADFNSFHKEGELVSRLPYEIQLRAIYTNDVFALFQNEVRNMMNCRVKLLEQNGPISKYEVKDRINNGGVFEPDVKNFEVWFHSEEVHAVCICRLFEFRGILCRHAISVLDYNDVLELPPQYVVARWRKDFKRLHAVSIANEAGEFERGPIERYDDIYMQCNKIAELGSVSQETFKQAMSGIKELEQRLLSSIENKKDISKIGIPRTG